MIFESIKMSWSNIIHNKLRSFLTILGIVIGVASIIALITIVQGATGAITDQITSLGADKLTVQTGGTPLKQGLTEADLKSLENIQYVRAVSPTVQSRTSVTANHMTKTDYVVSGKNQNFFLADPEMVVHGRALNILDIDQGTRVAVIGYTIQQEFFSGIDPVGRTILLEGVEFKVVGVLAENLGFSSQSANRSILIPYTTAMKTFGNRNIMSVDLYMTDSAKSDEIIEHVNFVLNQSFNYKENAFSVFNMQDMINAIGDVTGIMALLLAGIASISLIVGGIGIMNMMLVSVTERTMEIGLRKALGAKPSRIQLQFLIESIFLSMFGGFAGLLVGILVAFAASIMIGFTFSISFLTIFIAVGFSGAIGILFGYMPARKASRLNPIDALRHI
ncbi:MAG: ABC transporter permease [Saccharofermentanales bacterium]